MGVTGLWTVVQPCARPAKLETLNKKRLAVDASIWIYQFLKAVRDKEGNALRNSHVVGFFRRICKLLFVGIKPVFVFDGGAPVLKRQTVSSRKARREGRREDAVRTAGKLLAVQMQRRAEEDDRRRKDERDKPQEQDLPDEPVYVEEIGMSAQEKQQTRSFKKKDAYHLPDLDTNFAEMGAPNDPRIMSHEELEEYARQFHTGEDVNIYDFSKIDFNSDFFTSLPASDRYNILNAARLRSRLRMGYSKEQLDTMFPDRMAFSRFQIERVKERNELTQRLMNINGMNGEDNMFGVDGGGRIAGEKGKEYVLVKNEGVEGGWALGVVSNKSEGERNKPIDVEKLSQEVVDSDREEQDSEEDGFEDIPIEGLNRLPKRRKDHNPTLADFNNSRASDEIAERRKALYAVRQQQVYGAPQVEQSKPTVPEDPDSLFVPEIEEPEDELFEDVPMQEAVEDEELQKAIALSLEAEEDERPDPSNRRKTDSAYEGPDITNSLDFNVANARHGRNFAHQTNAKANLVFPKRKEVDDQDLESAPETPSGPRVYGLREEIESQTTPSKTREEHAQSNPFRGPLPFESLNLGTSMLSRKKKKVEDEGGGFDKDIQPEKPAQPLPPWFSGDVQKDTAAQKRLDLQQYAEAEEEASLSAFREKNPIRRQETKEIVDVDAPVQKYDRTINIESSEDEGGDEVIVGDSRPVDQEVRMDDVADLTRAEPPKSAIEPQNPRPRQSKSPSSTPDNESKIADGSEPEEAIDWEQSDMEPEKLETEASIAPTMPMGGQIQKNQPQAESPRKAQSPLEASPLPQRSSPGLENGNIPLFPSSKHISEPRSPSLTSPPRPSLPTEPSLNLVPADLSDEEDQYSDPEDADLFRQLAEETSEHARFASSLSKSAQSAEDYERELRQLRNQQKRDRRDADEVSHIMVTECQQLLKLFGIPYITAPMEAEAQCAELVRLGLVDGIVTDDSDIFLFGGTRVYKNMFNQAKFVECYLASDLEKEYSLTRQKLICIAHLLGSDYTEGLPSVGPVTALEILSDFGTLEAFAKWWEAAQTAPPPPSKSAAAHTDPLSSTPFRRKFRKTAATKLFLPTSFPDARVDAAYLHPEVDSDPTAFEWGVPDLDSLRSFLMATIGWTQERTDEILVPVIRDMNRREVEGTQANITKFFGGGVGVGAKAQAPNGAGEGSAPRRKGGGKSKRMENALGNLAQRARRDTRGGGEENDEVDDAPEEEADDETGNNSVGGNVAKAWPETNGKKGATKRKRPRTSPPAVKNGDGNDHGSTDDDSDEYQAPGKTRRKRGGRKQK